MLGPFQDSRYVLAYAQQIQEADVGNEVLRSKAPPTMLTKHMTWNI